MKAIHFNGSDDTSELILRTVISVGGFVWRISQKLTRFGETAATESMVIPTKFPAANPISRTDAEAQGNLLREYEQKSADLPEQLKLTRTLLPLSQSTIQT